MKRINDTKTFRSILLTLASYRVKMEKKSPQRRAETVSGPVRDIFQDVVGTEQGSAATELVQLIDHTLPEVVLKIAV